jgi:hypothetical protein
MSHNWHVLRATRVNFLSTVDRMEPATRQAWNDERMDEFAQRTEENFREVRAEVKGEVQGLRTEMNGRFASLEASINRRFDILFGSLATGIVSVVVSHFVG